MEFILAGVVMLFLTAFPNQSIFSPGALATMWDEPGVLDECAESLNRAPNVLDSPKPDRAMFFKLRGSFECHRPIFSYEERDPYIELVIRSETAKAKRVAQEITHRMNEAGTAWNKKGLGFTVNGSESAQLDQIVLAIYRNEIAQLLGPNLIRHSPARGDDFPLVSIRLHRVDVPGMISTVSLVLAGPKGESQWQELL